MQLIRHYIRTFERKEYDIDYSLDQIQKIIDPENYFRINRNFMLSINAIKDIESFSSSRLQIKYDQKMNPIDESFLVVSRDKVCQFKKWIDR